MLATDSEIKTQQKRTKESIIDYICLVACQFPRHMVSFCGIWKHFTGLISDHMPHFTPTLRHEKTQMHISVVRKAKKGCLTFAKALSADHSPLDGCTCVHQQLLQGILGVKVIVQKARSWSLSPCIGTYGGNWSRRREKVEESRSTEEDNSEHLRHLK